MLRGSPRDRACHPFRCRRARCRRRGSPYRGRARGRRDRSADAELRAARPARGSTSRLESPRCARAARRRRDSVRPGSPRRSRAPASRCTSRGSPGAGCDPWEPGGSRRRMRCRSRRGSLRGTRAAARANRLNLRLRRSGAPCPVRGRLRAPQGRAPDRAASARSPSPSGGQDSACRRSAEREVFLSWAATGTP